MPEGSAVVVACASSLETDAPSAVDVVPSPVALASAEAATDVSWAPSPEAVAVIEAVPSSLFEASLVLAEGVLVAAAVSVAVTSSPEPGLASEADVEPSSAEPLGLADNDAVGATSAPSVEPVVVAEAETCSSLAASLAPALADGAGVAASSVGAGLPSATDVGPSPGDTAASSEAEAAVVACSPSSDSLAVAEDAVSSGAFPASDGAGEADPLAVSWAVDGAVVMSAGTPVSTAVVSTAVDSATLMVDAGDAGVAAADSSSPVVGKAAVVWAEPSDWEAVAVAAGVSLPPVTWSEPSTPVAEADAVSSELLPSSPADGETVGEPLSPGAGLADASVAGEPLVASVGCATAVLSGPGVIVAAGSAVLPDSPSGEPVDEAPSVEAVVDSEITGSSVVADDPGSAGSPVGVADTADDEGIALDSVAKSGSTLSS